MVKHFCFIAWTFDLWRTEYSIDGIFEYSMVYTNTYHLKMTNWMKMCNALKNPITHDTITLIHYDTVIQLFSVD